MPHFTRLNDTLQVGQGADLYVVALRDGKLPVTVYDQSCNPWERGEQLVDPSDSPRWGQGWGVLDVAGNERWFASNWDSSG